MIQIESLFDRIRQRWNSPSDPAQIPAQVLAYMGDAVYELYVRLDLVAQGPSSIDDIHQRAVTLVRAESQAKALAAISPGLNEEELLVVRRGRNAHTHRFRKGAQGAYQMSTGFEALIGFLLLRREYDRLLQMLAIAVSANQVP